MDENRTLLQEKESVFCLNFFQLQNSWIQLRVVLSQLPVIPIFGELVYLIVIHERVSFYKIYSYARSRKESV